MTGLLWGVVCGLASGIAIATVDGFAGAPIAGHVARISAFGEDRQGDVVYTVVVVPSGAVPDRVRWNMKASVEIASAP